MSRAWPMLALPFAASLAMAAPSALATSTTQAFNYPFVNGSTLIGFRGTSLAPGAAGQASVRGEGGRMRIHAHFKGLGPANRFGPEYLTYVLWSISPLGRPTNLGEVVVKSGRAHVDAMTHLQSFGLIVTAEPHFAVTRVSNAIVLENWPLRDTRPSVEEVEARFDLLERGTYALEPAERPSDGDRSVSPYVFQARNALRIAQREEADKLAPSEFQAALSHLNHMEAEKHLGRTPAVLLARRAIQQAEDARLVAEKHQAARLLTLAQNRAEEEKSRADAAHQVAESAKAMAAQEAMKAFRQEREAKDAAKKATEAQLAVRRKLMEQLNRLLRTRETEEGLMATLTDVAFPSGRSLLAPPARMNLAKVAGILLAHPGLKIKVLGHTDATGQPAFNQRLSQDRAESVRKFLIDQGLSFAQLDAQGVDGTHPIASNATPEGRKKNRRVDLIVSGEAIGL